MSAWTSERPTKPGWYWWDWADGQPVRMIEVILITRSPMAVPRVWCSYGFIDKLEGKWQGPVEPLP